MGHSLAVAVDHVLAYVCVSGVCGGMQGGLEWYACVYSGGMPMMMSLYPRPTERRGKRHNRKAVV